MKYNKNWIIEFNKNKNEIQYEEILKNEFKDYKVCRECGNVIYYYDSGFRINRKDGLQLIGKSYLTKKNILDKDYYLSVCENCVSKKFENYKDKNKSRIFNRICDITNYAFNIPSDISEKWKKQNYSITLENLIIKHGKEEGEKMWKNYCIKQSLTNTFSYKKEKYGWDEEKFKEYNKSRSVTLDNLINKYGEEDGIKKWDNYCEKQRYSCSLEYFKEKYGELGEEKFNKFSNNRSIFWGYSKMSEELFELIIKKINKNWTYYYSINEYKIKSYLLDFYIKEKDICIEFNGDIWHANPLIFKDNDNPNPFNKDLTSKDIWEKDEKRINEIKKYIKNVFIIWENDLKKRGIDVISDEIINKINEI